MRIYRTLMICVAAMLIGACASETPTIAHVHLGHSITGAFDTPGRIGYLDYASQLAEEALAHADVAVAEQSSVDLIKSEVTVVDELTSTEIGKGDRRKKVILEASSHVQFAAQSEDASENVKAGYRQFEESVQEVLIRGGLISEYVADIQTSTSVAGAYPLALEVQKLAHANLHGEDLDGNGRIGDTPKEFGLKQIAETMDAIVADETPPYTDVDRWFLFNLIRLPDGAWIFRRPSDPAGDPY